MTFFYGTNLSAQCLILSPSHVIFPYSLSHLAPPAVSKAPAHPYLLHLLPSLFFGMSCFSPCRRMLKTAKEITTVQELQEDLHVNTVFLIPFLRSHCLFYLADMEHCGVPLQSFGECPALLWCKISYE